MFHGIFSMSVRQCLRQVKTLYGWHTFETTSSKNITPNVLLYLGLLLGILSSSVYAQDDEAAPIRIGESKIIPSARFEYRQTNNAFLTNTDQTEATAFVIKPRASWVADRRLLELTGIYEGEYATYSEEVLNYADHSLRAIVDAELSARNRLRRFSLAALPMKIQIKLSLYIPISEAPTDTVLLKHAEISSWV